LLPNNFDYFWHTDSGMGLADFTNRNFVSRNTNLDYNTIYTSPVATKPFLQCMGGYYII